MTADIPLFHEASQALAMYWDLVKNGGLTKKEYTEIKQIIKSKLVMGKVEAEDVDDLSLA